MVHTYFCIISCLAFFYITDDLEVHCVELQLMFK